MTFVFNEEDAPKTIKTFKSDGNEFEVTYVDGSTKKYQSTNPDEEIHKLNNEMLKAIVLRRAQSRVPEWRMARMRLGEILLLSATGASLQDENALITSVFAIGAGIFGYAAVKEIIKNRELKKYDMLLELYERFDEINEEINLQGEDLTLATADEFTYKEVKNIYSKFNGNR